MNVHPRLLKNAIAGSKAGKSGGPGKIRGNELPNWITPSVAGGIERVKLSRMVAVRYSSAAVCRADPTPCR